MWPGWLRAACVSLETGPPVPRPRHRTRTGADSRESRTTTHDPTERRGTCSHGHMRCNIAALARHAAAVAPTGRDPALTRLRSHFANCAKCDTRAPGRKGKPTRGAARRRLCRRLGVSAARRLLVTVVRPPTADSPLHAGSAQTPIYQNSLRPKTSLVASGDHSRVGCGATSAHDAGMREATSSRPRGLPAASSGSRDMQLWQTSEFKPSQPLVYPAVRPNEHGLCLPL